MNKAIMNGMLIDESEANVSVFDKGYFFDFSVYTSVKVVRGKVFFLDYHIKRLFESATLIGLGHPFTKDQVAKWTKELVRANGIVDGLLRMLLIGDVDGNAKAKLFIFQVSGLTFYPKALYRDGAKVITYSGERRVPGAKSKDLLMSFLAYREAKKADALDALLIDSNGNIREGTRTNLFAIKGETVIMPPSDLVLEGVTKKLLLESIKGHFEVKEANISAAELDQYDGFFITSTSMNVMPICQIDKIKLARPSDKTIEIMKLFREHSISRD